MLPNLNPHTTTKIKRRRGFNRQSRSSFGVGVNEEKKLWRRGYKRVACIDEVGRGPLAGPVVAAAVMVKKFSIFNFQFSKIKDSKKSTPKKREEFYKILRNHPAIKWGLGRVSEKVIDKINIKNASELAMEKALNNLEKKIKKDADFLIIDGNHINNLNLKSYNFKLITKADEKVFSCAAASIIAKVTRDRLMCRYARKYSRYGFEKHKGYSTKLHLKMLKKFGPCKIHRNSFKPLKRFN